MILNMEGKKTSNVFCVIKIRKEQDVMKIGCDCMVLLGKTGSGGRMGGFEIVSGGQSSVTAQAACRRCSGCLQLGRALRCTAVS